MLVDGDVPAQVQDFALAFPELHNVPVGLFLQSIEVPLDAAQLSGASTVPASFVSSANLISSLLASVAKLLVDILPCEASIQILTRARKA